MTDLFKKSLIIVLLLVTGCMTTGVPKEKKLKGEHLFFQEAKKAFDARDYKDAIDLFQLFIDRYPESPGYTIALQRLGESCEGLLETEYETKVASGEPGNEVIKEFLSQYGHYNCWEEEDGNLVYTLVHYNTIIEKYPESPIADEAAYRIIPWEKSYGGRPEGIIREISRLEEILERYPTTSLRYEILYKMAHRCAMVYEIFLFSPIGGVRDRDKAREYRDRALYLYKLALKAPQHTKFSEKAWKELSMLEEGKRIYLLE